MGADPNELARRAREILGSRNASCEAQAIRKAITGRGITAAADVKRLMSSVGTEFNRLKRDETRTRRVS